MKKQTGFNIPELMIVVLIAGILLAIALPNFQTLAKNNCLTNNTNSLVTSLQHARSEAVKRRENITIDSDSGAAGDTGWNDGWVVKDASSNVLREVSLTCKGATVTGSAATITYQSSGFTNNTANFTFTFCDDRTGETGRQITVNPVGRPNTNSKYTGCS